MKYLSVLFILGLLVSGCGSRISVPTDGSAEKSALSTNENQFLNLLNALRKEQGLTPLTVDPTLQATAAHHSSYMASKKILTHAEPSPNVSSSDRISNLGGSCSYSGENVAFGSTDAASLFDQWYGSSAHRANMLSNHFQFIGVSGNRGYWTADFGGE